MGQGPDVVREDRQEPRFLSVWLEDDPRRSFVGWWTRVAQWTRWKAGSRVRIARRSALVLCCARSYIGIVATTTYTTHLYNTPAGQNRPPTPCTLTCLKIASTYLFLRKLNLAQQGTPHAPSRARTSPLPPGAGQALVLVPCMPVYVPRIDSISVP